MKRIVLVALGILGPGLVIYWLAPAKPLTQLQQTLPDGSIVTIECVTFGDRHEFHFDDSWGARLHRRLPQSWQRHSPFSPGGKTIGTTRSNGVVLWVSHFNPASGQYLNVGGTHRLEVVDEHGCPTPITGWNSSGSGSRFTVTSLRLENFPRRAPTFKLRLKDRSTNGRGETLAEFDIPNPDRRAFPQWTPEPLPQARTRGDLTFVLTRFRKTGASRGPFSSPIFEVRQAGRVLPHWTNVLDGLHDATGNRHYAQLCTNETAWRLDVDFLRTAGAAFATNEDRSVPGLSVADAETAFALTRTGTVQDVRIKLFAAAGAGLFVYSNGVPVSPQDTVLTTVDSTRSNQGGAAGKLELQSGRQGGRMIDRLRVETKHPHLVMQVSGLAQDQRLLIRGRDDQGRVISADDPRPLADWRVVSLRIPPGATMMDLEFVVQRTRRVEFFVAPPQ